MHSSRMRTVRCSSRLLGEGVSAQGVYVWSGGVCPGGRGCLPRGLCLSDTPPHEQNDRHLWKHYLALTTLRTVVNMYPALVVWTCMWLTLRILRLNIKYHSSVKLRLNIKYHSSVKLGNSQPWTLYSEQLGVRVWKVLLYSGQLSANDKFYCIVLWNKARCNRSIVLILGASFPSTPRSILPTLRHHPQPSMHPHALSRQCLRVTSSRAFPVCFGIFLPEPSSSSFCL